MPVIERLERGRVSCARGAWSNGYRHLSSADASAPLGPEDLELLATSAYMVGREDEYIDSLERAYQLYLDTGETARATRAAHWIGMQLMLAGETGRGSGWLSRARRLVERETEDSVAQGYLLLPLAFEREATGQLAAAAATAGDAAAIAERFRDRDLFALAVHMQGHLLVRGGHVGEGLGLLDEAMVAVTAGELSPIVSGIVYCGVIMGCQAAYEPRRAKEWTAALTRWCERQPEMVAFSGRCHVHRAEIMQLEGAWSEALEEARCAASRAAEGDHRRALAEAAVRAGGHSPPARCVRPGRRGLPRVEPARARSAPRPRAPAIGRGEDGRCRLRHPTGARRDDGRG